MHSGLKPMKQLYLRWYKNSDSQMTHHSGSSVVARPLLMSALMIDPSQSYFCCTLGHFHRIFHDVHLHIQSKVRILKMKLITFAGFLCHE